MSFVYLIAMLALSIGAWFVAVTLSYRVFKSSGIITATTGLLAFITTAFAIMSILAEIA